MRRLCICRNCPTAGKKDGNGDTVDKSYMCIEGVAEKNPFTYISYDNFLDAMLTSLQVCTLDFWESVYNSVSDT